jgi:ribonuclease R
MPRSSYPRTDRDLLVRIGRSAGGKAGYKQLIRELGLGGGRERRLLLEQLTRMVARGDLIRSDDQMWSLPSREPASAARSTGPNARLAEPAVRSGRDRLVSGRLDLHRDGFGFVRPDSASAAAGKSDDIFIPPNEINGAMQGDLVLVDEAPPGRDGRRSGRIARVLTRRNPTVVGIFHYARPHGRRTDPAALPATTSLRWTNASLAPSPSRMVTRSCQQRAEPAPYGRRRGPHPAARRRSALPAGRHRRRRGDHRLPHSRTSRARAPARGPRTAQMPSAWTSRSSSASTTSRTPSPPPSLRRPQTALSKPSLTLAPDDLEAREDFRALPVVTIDGETARDFDDAVLVRPLANGNTELQVHIADVSHYVLPGNPLDTEARLRGTSVYFPDRAVPMLPHALSSGMCSLLPNEDRLVLSCIMEIDPQGEIVRYRVAEGLIRSRAA